jgi:hypothetical protein
VKGIAAIDDRIAWLEVRFQRGDGVVNRFAAGTISRMMRGFECRGQLFDRLGSLDMEIFR